MDLLVHVGLPAALIGSRGIPVDRVTARFGDGLPHEIGDDDRIGADADRLVLAQLQGLLGVGDKGGHVGTQEVLPIAQAHNQRRVVPDPDNQVGLPAVDDQDGEGALEHPGHTTGSLEDIRGSLGIDDFLGSLADELGGHLGVGGGGECVPFGLQVQSKLRGVFDDSVMDDGDPAVPALVGMGIQVGRFTVGGPAGVTDTHGRVRQGGFLDIRKEVLQPPGLLAHLDLFHTGGRQGHTGGVVSTVFEAPEAIQADFKRPSTGRMHRSGISNDSTHGPLV